MNNQPSADHITINARDENQPHCVITNIFYEECHAEYLHSKMINILINIKQILDDHFDNAIFLVDGYEDSTIFNSLKFCDELSKAQHYIIHIEELNVRHYLEFLIEDCYETIAQLSSLAEELTKAMIERHVEL